MTVFRSDVRKTSGMDGVEHYDQIMTQSQNVDVTDGPGGVRQGDAPCANDRREFLPSLDRSVTHCTVQVRDDPFSINGIHRDHDATAYLTGSQAINWCHALQPVFPVHVAGRRSGFLDAVTIAMWGVNRMASLLQRLVFVTLVEFGTTKFRERQYRQRKKDSEIVDTEIHDREWNELVKVASCEEHDVCSTMTFPEPLHVFVLSNILKRPIIVVSKNSNNLNSWSTPKSDSDFSGIYLPLLWDASDCVRTPIVLTIHEGHFLPLVGAAESSGDVSTNHSAVPLVTSNLEPLRILFLLEEEDKNAFEIQSRYLDLIEVTRSRHDATTKVLCARLVYENLEKDVDISTVCLRSGADLNQGEAAKCGGVVSMPANNGQEILYPRLSLEIPHPFRDIEWPSLPTENPLCPVEGCGHYGQFEYDWMCSRCFVQHGLPEAEQRQQSPQDVALLKAGHNSPTAPSASIVTLNRPTIDVPNYQEEPSIMFEHCRQDGCANFVSKFTQPYCYEHVDGPPASTTASRLPANAVAIVLPIATEPVESSIVMERCRHPGCPNYTSQFVYPVCYEHIDDRFAPMVHATAPVNNMAANETINVQHEFEPALMSMVDQRCAVSGCPHFASKFTYPVCYEHLDKASSTVTRSQARPPMTHIQARLPMTHSQVRPPMTHSQPRPMVNNSSHQNSASRWPMPVATLQPRPQMLQSNAILEPDIRWNPVAAIAERSWYPATPALDGSRYQAALVALEERSRTTTVMCRTPACTNYGNSKCNGYCHECHEMLASLASLP